MPVANDVGRRLAGEFDLGTPLSFEPVTGGSAAVTKLTTSRGVFLLKPVYRRADVELYATVEGHLNAVGVRQARLFRTTDGDVISSGYWVQEFLPGKALPARPSRAQADAVLRHLAAYDQALAGVDVPTELRTRDNLWTRVVSPGWLAAHLPDLVERGPGWLASGPVAKALEALAGWAPAFEALPRQVVHGDHGPDNVLYDEGGEAGSEQRGRVVAVLDFSPHHEAVLFGVACALYWFHVHPHASAPDAPGGREAMIADLVPRLRSSLAAYAEARPWSAPERALVGPMLLREALRRLATALAGAEEFGTPLAEESARSRYAALLCVLDVLQADASVLL